MVEPYEGRAYDPCCGSGGMFVQSKAFLAKHGGKLTDLSVYGQEFNLTTWKLAKMNLALQGINADLGDQWADTFRVNKHPDLRADHILANPPYNIDDWHRAEDDPAGHGSESHQQATPTTPGWNTSGTTSHPAEQQALSWPTVR